MCLSFTNCSKTSQQRFLTSSNYLLPTATQPSTSLHLHLHVSPRQWISYTGQYGARTSPPSATLDFFFSLSLALACQVHNTRPHHEQHLGKEVRAKQRGWTGAGERGGWGGVNLEVGWSGLLQQETSVSIAALTNWVCRHQRPFC